MSVRPISNCPASERPRKNSSPAISARNTGDWNWNPQPSVAPAARSTSSTPTSSPERDQNARRVDEAVRAQLVPLLAAGLHQRQPLQKQHRKDAGHQVQQQSAEKGEARDARTDLRH